MYIQAQKLRGSKCAVVGGAGFIGSHLVDAILMSDAKEVVVYDNFTRGKKINLMSALQTQRLIVVKGDIRDTKRLTKTLEGCQFVFHQAAIHLRRCEHHPREALEINELGSFNVAEACVKNGVEKLIAASSSSVYGEGIHFPTVEEHPFRTRLFYGAAKVGAEQYYRAFRHKYGLAFVGLRYLNVYGPRQDSQGAYTEVIMSFLNSIEEGRRPTIHGDGNQTLDLVFVSDAVNANLLALESEVEEGFLNVCTGTETTVRELYEILCRLCDINLEPHFKQDDLGLVSRRFGCPKAAETQIGFKASVSVVEGLKEVIAWRDMKPDLGFMKSNASTKGQNA